MTRTRLDWAALDSSFVFFLVWFLCRDPLQRPSNRFIEFGCWLSASIGIFGIFLLLRGQRTDLFAFIFPCALFYIHRWSVGFFVRRYGHRPRNTWHDWSTPVGADHVYNFLFAMFAILAPVLASISVEQFLAR